VVFFISQRKQNRVSVGQNWANSSRPAPYGVSGARAWPARADILDTLPGSALLSLQIQSYAPPLLDEPQRYSEGVHERYERGRRFFGGVGVIPASAALRFM